MVDPNISFELEKIAATGHSRISEEQKEFASNFTVPSRSFSDPGTGKTTTTVDGLFLAQSYYKIPGEKICCMSYTRNATNEIATRYQAVCKNAFVRSTVVFRTFHSITLKIVQEAYPFMKPVPDTINDKSDFEYAESILKSLGVDVSKPNTVYRYVDTMNVLNNAFIYEKEDLLTRADFLDLAMSFEDFSYFRKQMFMKAFHRSTIPQGDIPLYAWYALMENPEIAKRWKGKYQIMVIDEFQDMSLLHLNILKEVAENLVVIGDLKQQIFAYAGACPQIVEVYDSMFPNARKANLTKSFRCPQNICDFATRVIKPNDPTFTGFTGVPIEGTITMRHTSTIDWAKIAEDMKVASDKHTRSYMCLYRNNSSALQLVEELYRKQVPFRIDYVPLVEMELFDSLYLFCETALHPERVELVTKCLRLFPEYKYTNFQYNPILSIMKDTGKNFFKAVENVRFKERSSQEIVDAMLEVRDLYLSDRDNMLKAEKIKDPVEREMFNREHPPVLVTSLFNTVFNVYRKYTYPMHARERRFKNSIDDLIGRANPILRKRYDIFVAEEYDKRKMAQDCTNAQDGIRLYTMHRAKGLEADVVYLLDCDEGIFPNYTKFDKMKKKGAFYDAVEAIQQDRNLLFTAITRTKDELHIVYNGKPAELVANPEDNEYTTFEAQVGKRPLYDNAAAFYQLFNMDQNASDEEED